MTLAIAARIARRELRGGLGGFRVFLACLALGVAAIAAVGSVRVSIEQGLDRQGAALLGGDAEITFPYRFASPAERDWMAERATRVSETVDFRSMAVAPGPDGSESALTQLKGVDAAYPLYGKVALHPAMPLSEALADDGAVMERVLADRLGIAPGEGFRLGTKGYTLRAILDRAPDSAASGVALGARTILRREALRGSGLLAPGTLFDSSYRLALPEGTDLAALEQAAKARFADAGAEWRDKRNGAPAVATFVGRLAAFLVLVGLAGLAVGGVGVAAAVRAYLDARIEVIATLKTLGAEGGTILAAYLMQIGVLAALGIAIGLTLGAGLPLAFAPLIAARLPVPAEFGIHAGPLAEAALYGALTAGLFTLWPLARTRTVRAAALFRDASGPARAWPGRGLSAAMAGLLAALVGSAAALSGAPALALWAAGGVAAAMALLALAAGAIRALARRAARTRLLRGRTALRLALGAVGGPGGETRSVVLSLGLGLSVLAAIGQIDSNLRAAIGRELPAIAPSFFMLDIQDSQLDAFLDRVEGDPGVTRVDTAPMLRGVITKINGRPAREVAGDSWVVTGDRGVTYSARPPARTRITAGEWWPADYDGPPQVSFAAQQAEEIGLSLGDTLTVSILGRPVTATVTSFRDVDFSTAGIGFVLAMDPAALSGAPHTSIATVHAGPSVDAPLLRDLSERFPNITAIRVRDAIDRVSEVLSGIAAAVTCGAAATLVTGVVVLIGAAAAGQRARVFEAAVLKTVGASRARILAYFALRSALLGATAGIVAIGAGALAGWAVTRFVMETGYAFAPGPALAIVAGGAAATLLAGLAFAWRPLAVRPARVLRARE